MEVEELQERKHEIGQLSSQGAQYMQDGDLQNAVLNYENAYKLAREINNDKIERSCAFNLGAAFIVWDKPSEGMEYLHKALPPDGQIDDRSNGDLYFNMGLGHEKMENKRKALVDFIKAYEEYANRESERVDEQIQCLEKCLDIYKSWNDRPKMAETCKQMAEVFERRKDDLGRADKLCEQASVLRHDGKQDDAVSVAEDCMNLLNNTHTHLEGEDCTVAAKILNDLGLVFTQLQKYDEATSCFEKAVEMVHNSHKIHPQLEAVVLQNLGAAYNFSNDFQRAIKYHEDAAAKYAKINYRNGQGQCFTNLAFALSQQGDMKRAEVAFHHALQASKDTGDNHMKWQAYEGIGAVNYNQGNIEEAINFFMEALRYVGENTAACERIKSKLYYAMAAQGQSFTPSWVQGQTMQQWAPAGTAGYRASAVDPTPRRLMPTHGPLEEHSQMSATPRSQMMVEEQIFAQKSAPMAGEQPRMSSVQDEKPRVRVLRMRKADSFGFHKPKIARGLESGTLETPREPQVARGSLRRSILEDEEEEEEEEDDSSDDSEESSEEEVNGFDDPDRVTAGLDPPEDKITQIFSRPSGFAGLDGTAGDSPLSRYEKQLRDQEEEEESSEESSTEESSEDSDEEDDTQSSPRAPPLPTQSPPTTAQAHVGTYLTPAPGKGTQHSPSVSRSRVAEQRQPATSDDDEDKNPYALIDTTAKQNRRGVEGQGPSKDTEDESAMEKLPRGQREMVLAQYHQEHRSQEPPDLPPRKGEKNSKTCIIM